MSGQGRECGDESKEKWMSFLQVCLHKQKGQRNVMLGISSPVCKWERDKRVLKLWCFKLWFRNENFCWLLSITFIYFKADGKKQKQNQSQVPVTGLSIPTQPLTRPLQPLPPLQPSPVQQPGVPTSGPSQTTIHVLPTGNFIWLHCVSAVAAFFLELDCCVFYIVLIFLSEYSECWSHFIIFHSSHFPVTFFLLNW